MNNIKIIRKDRPIESFITNRQDNKAYLVYQDNNLEILRYHMPLDQIGIIRTVEQKGIIEIYNIEEGSLELTMNQEKIVLNDGDMFIVNYDSKNTPFKILKPAMFTVTTNQPVFTRDKEEGEELNIIMDDLQDKDGDTREHCNRVQLMAMALALELKIDPDYYDNLFCASRFHDVGKTKIPLDIIIKAASLNEAEYEIMKKHSEDGYEIVKSSFGEAIAKPVLQHHERIDGLGYPNHLVNEEICIEAKIISVVDAYDAMRTIRPYNKGKSKQEAIDQLIAGKGSQFDEQCVDAFINVLNKHKEW